MGLSTARDSMFQNRSPLFLTKSSMAKFICLVTAHPFVHTVTVRQQEVGYDHVNQPSAHPGVYSRVYCLIYISDYVTLENCKAETLPAVSKSCDDKSSVVSSNLGNKHQQCWILALATSFFFTECKRFLAEESWHSWSQAGQSVGSEPSQISLWSGEGNLTAEQSKFQQQLRKAQLIWSHGFKSIARTG